LERIVQWDCDHLPLRSGSVDMIFSDPPYGGDAHWCELVAREAMRLLKPGGFVALMCGGLRLNRVMRMLDDAGLDYYWLYKLGMGGAPSGIVWIHRNRNIPITVRLKEIVVYSKGRSQARVATSDLFWSDQGDKRWHFWGQCVNSHRYYIDCFSKPGDLVLDPFGGGGTTAVACEILGRRWIIGDLDPAACQTMQRRLYDDGSEMNALPLFAGMETQNGYALDQALL
jgi:hypothetical protein